MVIKRYYFRIPISIYTKRLISDNIMIGHECLNAIKNHKYIKMNMVALKIDLSKAYDRVEWSYLEGIILKMGFDRRWIELILRCITIASFSIIINGEQEGKKFSSRGLHQGDPLPPYLFLLVAEGLSNLISKANFERKLLGMICSNGPLISHLLFANDSLIFCKADERELVFLREFT